MEIKAGLLYRHSVGTESYRVMTLAISETDGKVMVVYQSEARPELVYVRPHTQFIRLFEVVEAE